jgi:hypothetical protein
MYVRMYAPVHPVGVEGLSLRFRVTYMQKGFMLIEETLLMQAIRHVGFKPRTSFTSGVHKT